MEKKKFLLRLDQQIYDSLERWAADDLRSVNAQVEFILTEALKKQGRFQRAGQQQTPTPPTSTAPGEEDHE